jgi:hypothetical protein
MDFEFGNQYLLYIAILLCLNIILFYVFYKLYLKINVHSDKLDKLDKLLADIFIDNEKRINTTSKESTKSKKQQKIVAEEKKEILNIDDENLEIKEETNND